LLDGGEWRRERWRGGSRWEFGGGVQRMGLDVYFILFSILFYFGRFFEDTECLVVVVFPTEEEVIYTVYYRTDESIKSRSGLVAPYGVFVF